jgi:hypothetical protein
MRASRLDTWSWVFVYGGLILLGLGLSVRSGAAALGWVIALVGVALVAIGIVLIWVRSRIKVKPGSTP